MKIYHFISYFLKTKWLRINSFPTSVSLDLLVGDGNKVEDGKRQHFNKLRIKTETTTAMKRKQSKKETMRNMKSAIMA